MPESQKIASRPGLEVYTNQEGTISISQDDPLGNDDRLVVVHPDDVDRLCEMLTSQRDAMAAEAAEIEKQKG
jgi:hypothetical protein